MALTLATFGEKEEKGPSGPNHSEREIAFDLCVIFTEAHRPDAL